MEEAGADAFDRGRGGGQGWGVLREIKNLKQEAGSGRRRWFESGAFDLIVWLGARGTVEGFQICYDLGRGERALTWRSGTGFAHSVVDAGEATPFKNSKTGVNYGPVTLSLGLCLAAESDNPQDLYQKSDIALYCAKSDGRNRVTMFEDGMKKELSRSWLLYKK